MPLYSKCWTQDGIDRYFTSEAMSKARTAFNEVHVPIDRIRVDPQYPAGLGRQEISEQELGDIIRASRPDQSNRIFLIVGDTGSGKSELCQWLNYNVGDNVHVPILIERRMIHLREIVEEIHRHLTDPLPENIIEITDLWPETVSAKLRAAVLMRLQQPLVQNAVGMTDITKLRNLLDTPDFERRMRKHFEHYRDEISQLDKPRQLQLLPDADFRDLALQAGGLRDPSLAYRHVQRAMSDCLASELRLEDMIKKLGRISDGYRAAGKRPVLLIEDITTFGFLQNDLLDYLYNLAGGNYDVVIGVTTGFEQENRAQIYNAQQTITERIQGRFELTDQHNETLFLREHHLELAKRYLLAIRNGPCVGNPAAFDQAFYPFNQTFLGNIYRSLHQGQSRKQTPRLYLRAIQSVLESDQLPTDAIELSPNVSEPGIYFGQNPGLSPAAERMLKWYGLNTRDGVFLHELIAKTFGISFPDDTQRVADHYRFPLRPGAEMDLPEPPAQLATTLSPRKPPQGPGAQPKPTAVPAASAKSSPLAQLDEWLALKGQFPDRNVFKDGVYALLDMYQFEPFVLRHPDSIADSGTALVYDRGEKYSKIYLHHSADDRPFPKLTLRPDVGKRDLFSQVLAIGARSYTTTESERLDQAQLHDWLRGAVEELHKELQDSLRQGLRMPLADFIALAKFLILNLTSDIYTLDAATLCRPITGEPLALDGMGERGRHLWANRDHVQALFVGLFHYRDNLVNYPLLRSTLASVNPVLALKEIEHIDLNALPSGFRIKVSGSEIQFGDMVRVLKSYATYLNALIRSHNYELVPTEEDLRQVLGACSPRGCVDTIRLRAEVDRLKAMAHKAHINWQQRWDLEMEPLHRNPKALHFDVLYDELSALFAVLENAALPLNVFAYLAFQRRVTAIAANPAFDVAQAILQMHGPLNDQRFRQTLYDPQESREYQDYQRAYRSLREVASDGFA